MAYTTVDNPELYFQTKLYTGNGSNGHAITLDGDENMQPDWVWIKDRGSNSHRLTDSVRGATKVMYSDLNFAEVTDADTIQSFDSNGFTLDDDADTNGNGQNFVSWNWKAGGSAVTNNDGDITSTVSANNTAGFSIVTWTGDGSGANVGTGLSGSETLGFATVKKRSTTSEWFTGVYGAYASNARNFAYHLELNSTSALSGSSPYMMGTQTSGNPTKLKLASEGYVNGVTYVAYVFKPVKGYSAMGAYTGNGNADGPFIYTGFRPAWVLQKNAGASQGWQLQDNKRLGYNPDNYLLQPHTSQAESALQRVDLLSNGFKVRTTDAGQNSSGTTYIYMAFAESPFVNSKGVPTNGR